MSKDMIAWKIHIVLSNINLVNSPPPEGGGLLAKIVKVMKRYTYIIHYDNHDETTFVNCTNRVNFLVARADSLSQWQSTVGTIVINMLHVTHIEEIEKNEEDQT